MHDIDDEYRKRKFLNFSQAEGAEPLPRQLKKDEVSTSLRAAIWNFLYTSAGIYIAPLDYEHSFSHPWDAIYYDVWLRHMHRFADEYNSDAKEFCEEIIGQIVKYGDYIKIFSLLEFILRHPDAPSNLHVEIQHILTEERAAFRIVNDDTFCPVASAVEIEAISHAIELTKSSGLIGASAHFRASAVAATAGAFADSVRESIHAVESVARSLTSRDNLAGALAVLESKKVIHHAMKRGFNALYGYTSDEKGIRHPLLEDGAPAVNEADALFMLGACASFVSYMISRAREARLIAHDDA